MPGPISIAIVLLITDILAFLTINSGRLTKSRLWIRNLRFLHPGLSLLAYGSIILILLHKGEFAENANISRMMFLGFLISLIWTPRLLIIIFTNAGHYLQNISVRAGKIVKQAGIIMSLVCIILILGGTFIGRFNFNYKVVEIEYKNLPAELKGFRIVHLSDMHLSSFHRHSKKLQSVVDKINTLEADIVVNTGDFVTYAWNEMAPFVDILAQTRSSSGNYAIPGNHDAGTYHPFYDEKGRLRNIEKMDSLIAAAGYVQLKDSSVILEIDSTTIKIAGLVTKGKVPDIIFGDLDKALKESPEADFTILLSHDPNHWYRELQENENIELTLSGHTHGSQMGIELGKLRWCPASGLYPAWGGVVWKKKQ